MQGWINYYGGFYKSELYPLLRRIDTYLVRWAKRKYKRLPIRSSTSRWPRSEFDTVDCTTNDASTQRPGAVRFLHPASLSAG